MHASWGFSAWFFPIYIIRNLIHSIWRISICESTLLSVWHIIISHIWKLIFQNCLKIKLGSTGKHQLAKNVKCVCVCQSGIFLELEPHKISWKHFLGSLPYSSALQAWSSYRLHYNNYQRLLFEFWGWCRKKWTDIWEAGNSLISDSDGHLTMEAKQADLRNR